MERKFNSFMASFILKQFLINSATKQLVSSKRYCLVSYGMNVSNVILTFIYSAPMSFLYIFTEKLKKATYGTKCGINVLFDEIYASCLMARYTFGLKIYLKNIVVYCVFIEISYRTQTQ